MEKNPDAYLLYEYMKKIAYTVTDGNLMVELNALPDKFCISFQVLSKKPKAFDIFCGVLEEVGLPYKASDRLPRYLPDLSLPKR